MTLSQSWDPVLYMLQQSGTRQEGTYGWQANASMLSYIAAGLLTDGWPLDRVHSSPLPSLWPRGQGSAAQIPILDSHCQKYSVMQKEIQLVVFLIAKAKLFHSCSTATEKFYCILSYRAWAVK
jgi:hypothetical protein